MSESKDHHTLEEGMARIRGILQHEVRSEDRDCALFMIEEIVQEMIGDRPGIFPFSEGETA